MPLRRSHRFLRVFPVLGGGAKIGVLLGFDRWLACCCHGRLELPVGHGDIEGESGMAARPGLGGLVSLQGGVRRSTQFPVWFKASVSLLMSDERFHGVFPDRGDGAQVAGSLG